MRLRVAFDAHLPVARWGPDEPFPDGRNVHPEWRAFWTLDEQRGGPPKFLGDGVENAAEVLEILVSGRMIATIPEWVPGGLTHPGVVALPLGDAPRVSTRLVWRSEDGNAAVDRLVDLARDWTRRG